MNTKLKIFVLTMAVCVSANWSVFGNDYLPYQWEENRSLTKLSEEETAYGLYYLKCNEVYQYVYDESDGSLLCYITTHNIIYVGNDEALNKSNQLYIPMRSTIELTDVKARAISKDGRVINFDENNIKALEEDESGYKILAIEGAEVGGEIEYYYTRKTYASAFVTKYFQYSFPIKSYEFSLRSPENLIYDFKVYNDQGSVNKQDTSDQFNHYVFKANDIPALYEEGFSAYENNKGRLEVKLAYNLTSSVARLNTWGAAGKRLSDLINNFTTEEEKELSKFLKKHKFTGAPIDILKQYEHYVKTNFSFQEEAGEEGIQLDQILKNRYANSRGFTRLFSSIMNQLGIDHEIVMVSDRSKNRFDPDFNTWNYLGEYILYVNEVDQFLSPKDTPFRLGTIPSSFIGSPALFIRPEKIQDFIYPVAHIAQIPAPSYKYNFDNMDLKVSFTNDLTQNKVQATRSFAGYTAEYYKAAMLVIDEENKKQLLDQNIKYMAPDAEIDDIKVIAANDQYDTWDKPFTLSGTFTTNSYIESAGDVILFKAGELIGPQSELYQKTERSSEIVNEFNRGYLRKIKVNIPKGYKIQNPEDLVIKKQVFEGDRLIFNFDSKYTMDGQVLNIEIDEFYDKLYYPKEKFEEFREVINAAADWNKIVLVLEQ